jgi:hypothetical protein
VPGSEPKRRSGWRLARRILIGLFVLGALGATALYLVVRNLDARVVKTSLRDLVRSQSGLELDYETAEARILSGLRLTNVTVASPPEVRAIAPLVLRAESLDLGWSFLGRGPTLQKVDARVVDITIVVDENGRTSLDGLRGSSAAEPEEEAVTPGHALAHALESLPAFGRIALDRVTVTVLHTDHGRVVMRDRIDGLAALAVSRGSRARTVKLDLGRAGAPLACTYTHDEGALPHGEAKGHLFVDASLSTQAASVKASITFDQQTLTRVLPRKGTLLAVDGNASAERERLHLSLARFDVFEHAIDVAGVVDVEPARAHVEKLKGTFELGRLVHLVPAERMPVELKDGKARIDTVGLELSTTPSIAAHGHLDLDGTIVGLRWEHDASAIAVPEGKLVLRGKPTAKGGLQLTASSPEATLRVVNGSMVAALEGLAGNLSLTLEPDAPGHADVHARFASGTWSDGARSFAATNADVSARAGELRLDRLDPVASDAALSLALAVASFDGRASGVHARAATARLDARTRVQRGAPGAIDLTLPVGELAVNSARDAVLVPPGPARLGAHFDHWKLDPAGASHATGEAKLDLAVGPLTAGATVRKRPDAIEYQLVVDARSTALLTAFAPPALKLPGARMSLHLASTGRLDGLHGTLRLSQKGQAHLEQPAVTLRDETLSAQAIDLTLDSDGTLQRHTLTLGLKQSALALDDERLGDGQLTAHLRWDATRPAIDLQLDGAGQALPSGQLHLAASFDRRSRLVDYAIDGDLGHLAALEPLLPASLGDEHWLDLSDMHARIAGHGKLTGLVASVDTHGTPTLEPRPLETLRGDSSLDLGLANVHYVDDAGVELTVPAAQLLATVHGEGARKVGHFEAHIGRATVVARDHKLEIDGLDDRLEATLSGDPLSGDLDVRHDFTLARLGQDVVAVYPIGQLALTSHARRSPDGKLVLDSFQLTNQAAGTRLSLSGGLLLPRGVSLKVLHVARPLVGWRSLSLRVALEQRLDTLAGDAARLRGGGSVALDAELASGDLKRFHTAAKLAFRHASLELPARRVHIAGLDGELPLVEDVAFERGGARLLPAPESNNYPLLRFSDQQPFLSGPGSLRIDRVQIGDFVASDIAGNLRIARNLFSIDQLETQVHGGRIAGQALLDWRGKKSTLQLHLRASNIQAVSSGQRERFDGNAALVFSLERRAIDGRAEILRIGRLHLLELLDEYDPHHTDAASNRVRHALALGYPDRVRLLFDRGFASLSVQLGGLGRLVKIDEVRGIPTGPLVDRYLGPLLSTENDE